MLVSPFLLLDMFVVTVMLAIGLRVSRSDLISALRNRRLLLRALLANCVIVPALGFLLAALLPMEPDQKLGLLFLAVIPGTPVALQFTRKAKSGLAVAAGLIFLLTLVSLAITPLALEVMPQAAVAHHPRPLLRLLETLLLYLALPLWVGLTLSHRAPRLTSRLVMPLNIFATVTFLALMLETREFRRQAMKSLSLNPLAAIVLLIVLAMATGWLPGRPRPRIAPRAGHQHQHAQHRDLFLSSPLLVSGNRGVRDALGVSLADGANQRGIHPLREMGGTAVTLPRRHDGVRFLISD